MKLRTVLLVLALMMLVLGIVDFYYSPERVMESGTWVSYSRPVKFVDGNVVTSGQVWATYKFVKRNQVVFEVEEFTNSFSDINSNPRPMLLNVGVQSKRQRLVFTTLNSGSYQQTVYVFNRPRSNPRIASSGQGASSRPTQAVFQPPSTAKDKIRDESISVTLEPTATPFIEVQYRKQPQPTSPPHRNTQNAELQVLRDRGGIVYLPKYRVYVSSTRSHGTFQLKDAERYCRVRSMGGINSWRLPTATELQMVFRLNEGEIRVSSILPFWTSTMSDEHSPYKRAVVFWDGEEKAQTGGIASVLCVSDSR